MTTATWAFPVASHAIQEILGSRKYDRSFLQEWKTVGKKSQKMGIP